MSHPEPDHPREIQWALRDLVDVAELHPMMAGLMLELPWHAPDRELSDAERRSGGRRPEWSELRRDAWLRAVCMALDLLYVAVPDDPDDPEMPWLLDTVIDDKVGAVERFRLPAAFGQAPDTASQQRLLPPADLSPIVRRLERERDELRAQLAEAQAELEDARRGIEALKAAIADQPQAQDESQKDSATTPEPSQAPTESHGFPCDVDGCDGRSASKAGRWNRVCPTHRERLVAGESLIIRGKAVILKAGPGGGRIMPAPTHAPDTHPASSMPSDVAERLHDVISDITGEDIPPPHTADANVLAKRIVDKATTNHDTPTVPSQTDPRIPLDAAPCKIDDCTNHGPRMGRWSGICDEHQAHLLDGGTVVIDSQTHRYIEHTKGVGSVRPLNTLTQRDIEQQRELDRVRAMRKHAAQFAKPSGPRT